MTEKLRYGVVGTGALGGFYGGMLAKAGKEVHFLFHSDFAHVRDHGLRVDSVLGDFHLPQVKAYAESRDMPACDVVLVCLKTTSDHLLEPLLKPLLHEGTLVILIQNGLGNEQRLASIFPQVAVAGGLGFICSGKVGPGHIHHQDYGRLTLGWHSGDGPERLDAVLADLDEAGVPVEKSLDLLSSRWKKLVWNVPYNGLCVVMDALTSQLMDQPSTKALLKALMLEVIGAAEACGVPIGAGFADAMLESTSRMKPYAPSMKLDFDHRRPMEIDAIYSQTLRTAELAGFDMPCTRMLERQLLFIQSSIV